MIMCTFKRIAVSDYGLYRKFRGGGTLEEYAEFLARLAAPESEYSYRQEKSLWGTDGTYLEMIRCGADMPAWKECPQRPDILIIREKNLPEETYLELFEYVWKASGRQGDNSARIIPHTHLSAVRRMGCTSIHLPLSLLKKYREEGVLFSDQNPFWEVKHIGVSIHSLEEAKTAKRLGAAYLTAGHIFATDCKRGAPPRGIAFLEEICGSVTIPVYAIGGICPENLHEIKKTNAAGACMMSEYMKYSVDTLVY